MYVDGGAGIGGKTFEIETSPGTGSQQDDDAGIQFLGVNNAGGGGDVQYIGLIDELVIYNKALTETHARLHYLSAVGQTEPPPKFNAPTFSGGQARLSWTGTGRLQEASALSNAAGTWADVTPQPTGTTYSTAPGGAQKFYRLVR